MRRRDQPNPGALVAGALFIVIGVVYLIDQSANIDVRWIWPTLLIGLGVAGLVRSRPREPRSPK